ncbi:dynein regulatory complex protein 8 isoform X2 [Hoplias malabaricus]|uniref:dynein regulatory complex protein 8 isoform X2 n=1 Tax=Hoplias malabaricus TaxID=27720 RepID=UPI0034631863
MATRHCASVTRQQRNMAEGSAGSAVSELQKRITSAFEVFDHECNHTVDVREVGTIIRSLGCFPTEAELHDVIAEIEEEEPTGFVRFEKFLPTMTRLLLEHRFRPVSEDLLLQAFEVKLLCFKREIIYTITLLQNALTRLNSGPGPGEEGSPGSGGTVPILNPGR